jgi:hypothetical protein
MLGCNRALGFLQDLRFASTLLILEKPNDLSDLSDLKVERRFFMQHMVSFFIQLLDLMYFFKRRVVTLACLENIIKLY